MSDSFCGAVAYNNATNTYTVSSAITTPDLNQLIAIAADNAVIQFEAGTYVLTEQVSVLRGNLTLKGAGEGVTTFEAHFDAPQNTFLFYGTMSDTIQTAGPVSKGSTAITVADGSAFKAGDQIHVYQSNDAAFINQPLPQTIASDPYLITATRNALIAGGTLYGNAANDPFMSTSPLRDSLTVVEKVVGNTLYLKDAVAFDMTAAQVQKINALQNLHVSDFTISNNLGTPNPALFENTKPDWQNTHAIAFFNTAGTEVKNLTILNAASAGFTAARMYDADVSGITISGAHNKGGGGNGYGLNLAGAQHSEFSDLTILDVRHAVIFSSWGTEIGNTIHVATTNRDINYHGGPDQGNIVTVDESILNYYGNTASSTYFSSIGAFGAEHPYTDMTANATTFTYALGYRANDVITGSDKGAYLRGGYGQDILIGGAGNDVLIGDTQADTLTGGKGADLFVMTNETAGWGATDTILDFNAAEGDKILFYDINRTVLRSDICLTQMGNDLKVSVNYLDSVALIKNMTVARFSLDSVLLNQKPYDDNPLTWQTKYMGYTDPAQNLTAKSSAAESFVTGSGDDTVTGVHAYIMGDTYNLGAGRDTLTILVKCAFLPVEKLPTLKGVDVIDISNSDQVSRFGVDDALVRQSDNGVLTLRNDATRIEMLSAKITDDKLALVIESAGDVYLADKINNRITTGEHNTGAIFGGTGKDALFGGAGADVFSGGKGADLFSLGVNHAGKFDTIKDFRPSDGDVLDISKMLSGYDKLQSAIDDFVYMTKTDNLKTEIWIDRDGTAGRYGAEKSVVLEAPLDQTLHDLIAKGSLIVS